MRWRVILFGAAAVALVAAAWVRSPAHRTAADQPGPALAGFGDGQWAFRVDRAWDGTSGRIVFPSDPLEESDYQPVDDGPTYPVTVTENAAVIAVGDPPITGARAEASDERVRYDLTEGVFAGGRFVVWGTDAGLQAELTIYGSGRPIIGSERGPLVPDLRATRLFVPACAR